MFNIKNVSNSRFSTPPGSSESDMSSSLDYPHPQYYVVRPDKSFVPLIAIDEIDPMVRIHGVPTSLTAADVEEWNMARCGDQLERHQNYYRIEITTHANVQSDGYAKGASDTEGQTHPITQVNGRLDPYANSQASAQHARYTSTPCQSDQMLSNTGVLSPIQNSFGQRGGQGMQQIDHVLPQHPAGASPEYAQAAVDQMVQENKWAKEQHHSKTKNAATPGVYGKKKFCTYWIRTGNCDYVQEGCKYLHVIPNEETRLRIGIRDMPRWAKEDIPAPQYDSQLKQHPATSQDWRRHAPQAGQINEVPEISRSQTRHALPPPTPTVYTTNHLNTPRTQTAKFPSPFFNSPAQHFPTNASHMAQPTPVMQQGPFNSASSSTPFKSATSAATESYQRQMQAGSSACQPIPPTPTSAAHRYSPPTQPPISRPVNGGYRAPDKMPNDDQAEKQGQDQQQAHLVSTLASVHSQRGSPSTPLRNGRVNASLNDHSALSPLPSHLANTSSNARVSTPIVNGINGSAPTRTNTPHPQAHSAIGHQAANRAQTSQHSGQMDVNTPAYEAQIQRALGSMGGSRNVSQNGTSNSDAAKRMINGHITGNVNGTLNSHATNNATTQLDDLSNGQANTKVNGNTQHTTPANVTPSATPPVVLHRRHFIAPGESEYVATSLEAEKMPAKKNGNGGQKKRPRGRGGNHADLADA